MTDVRETSAAAPTASTVEPRPSGNPVLHAVPRFALLAMLIGAMVFYSLWSPTTSAFGNGDILRNIVSSQAVLAVVTLGMLVPLIAGQIDLSIGNITGLSSILTASAYADYGAPVWLGVLVGIGTGVLVGAVNGFVITVLKVQSFVATLGTASIIVATVSWYTAGLSIIQGIPAAVPAFGRGRWLGIPRIFIVMLVVALLVYYVLEHTPYGRKLHAIGANREAARLVGIRVPAAIFGAFVLEGGLAGLAGVMLLSDSGAGNPQVGNGFTLTAVAAVFLGAAAFHIGRANVPGTLVAIYFIAVNITGLTLAGVRDYIQPLFSGVSLVLAIGLVAVLARRRARSGGQGGAGVPGT